MNTKHTAGTWQVSKTVNDFAIYSSEQIMKDIAAVYKNSRSIPQEEAEANAKLIAAAPELLEMCIATLEDLQSGELTGNATECAIINLRDAIRNATN